MEIKEALSILSGILFTVGFIPYIQTIRKGKTKPAKASWIIWTILDLVVLAGMIAEDSVNGQIIGAVTGAAIVVFLAMKHGTPGWTKTDKFTLGGAALGIALWIILDSPIFGIITSCTVAVIGSLPTLLSVWKDPSKESKLAWTIFFTSCVCAMAAIPQLTFEHATQPTAFFLIESAMMIILYFKKKPQPK